MAGDPDGQYLVFDCGALGEGNHGHLDCLSFELAAFGRSLIVDPGRYTYFEGGPMNERAAFRGTQHTMRYKSMAANRPPIVRAEADEDRRARADTVLIHADAQWSMPARRATKRM